MPITIPLWSRTIKRGNILSDGPSSQLKPIEGHAIILFQVPAETSFLLYPNNSHLKNDSKCKYDWDSLCLRKTKENVHS
jgi:hypothetical protein